MVHHCLQGLVRDRGGDPPGMQGRHRASEARFHCADVVVESLFSLAIFNDKIDQSTPVELVRGVDLSGENHVVCGRVISLSYRKMPTSHSWKEVEQHFGEPRLCTPFKYDGVMKEGGFEAAPKCVALDEGGRVDAQRGGVLPPPHQVDAAACIETK